MTRSHTPSCAFPIETCQMHAPGSFSAVYPSAGAAMISTPRPRPAPTWPAACTGPPGPAVAAATGCQCSRFLAIGTALAAVCAACSAPQQRAPPYPLRDTNPGATPEPQPHARRAPGSGHAVRQGLNTGPSPQPAGPRQAPAGARLGRHVHPVYSISGAQVPRGTCQLHGNRGEMLSRKKQARR